MGAEARQAPAEGSGRPLDGEIHQSQAEGGRQQALGHRDPELRLPEPRLDRPRARRDRWSVTDAARFEGAMLREGLLDKTNTASSVWADSAYRSKANEAFLAANGLTSRIHRKKPQGMPMPEADGPGERPQVD